MQCRPRRTAELGETGISALGLARQRLTADELQPLGLATEQVAAGRRQASAPGQSGLRMWAHRHLPGSRLGTTRIAAQAPAASRSRVTPTTVSLRSNEIECTLYPFDPNDFDSAWSASWNVGDWRQRPRKAMFGGFAHSFFTAGDGSNLA